VRGTARAVIISALMPAPIKIAVVLPLLAVALVSFVFVRAHQSDAGTLVSRQHQAQALNPAAVSRLVRVAPDPVTRAPGVRARCTPLGTGDLLNPWSCSISYRSGRLIMYQVTLNADGSYTGDHEIVRYHGQRYRDSGVISGCCVSIP
jgi:hypothetical protein